MGTVTSQSGTKTKGIMVGCDNKRDLASSGIGMTPRYSVTTDAHGAFQISTVPAGVYVCFAETADSTIHQPETLIVKPLTTTPANLTTCTRCVLGYHGGPVIHSLTAYLIYWSPAATTIDPAHGNTYFEAKISQYFHDISGSSFYAMLKQYYDWQGPIQNHVVIGGTFTDKTPYPQPGTQSKPVHDEDIQTEIQQDIDQNQWQVTNESVFFIFTANHIQICQDYTANAYCTFGKDIFCGYHTYINAAQPIIYAVEAGSTNANCTYTGITPNGDGYIDANIDILAHEQYEAVTDPFPYGPGTPGWYQNDPKHTVNFQEIGDLCENATYYSIFPDGGNISLNGHDYLIQPMWNNQAGTCTWR